MQIPSIQESYTIQCQNIIARFTVLHWKLVSIITTVCQTATVDLHLRYMCMTYSVFTCFSDYNQQAAPCPVSKLPAAKYHHLANLPRACCAALGRLAMSY